MATAASACLTCGAQPRDNARFCDNCGSPIAAASAPAEYKQVTVLFADVVHSMDLAAFLEPERLRDIIAALFNRSAAVVQRYGGTVDKFTGDGIMALFGAPVALEDHAVRACLAALDIQREILRLAADVKRRDGIDLQLRIGLNSGQVIAGEIDPGPGGYTVVGAQVGLAQRMESVAPPGGVMLSESTAALVEHVLVLEDPESVQIKGVDQAIRAQRLMPTTAEPHRIGRHEPTLVGRDWEMATVTGILKRAVKGSGAVVGVVGPPGIGKSRIVSETVAIARSRGVAVCTATCESHESDIPFQAVGRLLRVVLAINDLDRDTARIRLRATLLDAGSEDLMLFEDLLGIRDTDAELPDINADARRRRLTRMINAALLARTTPTLYIVEDMHWIDEVSDAMFADMATVIPQSRAMVLVTYRPEYQGGLSRTPNAHRLTLVPLDDSEFSSFTNELVGSHPSVAALAEQIGLRAGGNPFFAQEIVRDLSERGVLEGDRGAYVCRGDTRDVYVPVTVQATIAARVDRLDASAKRTLLAASVIGTRFSADLLADVLGETEQSGAPDDSLATLVSADIIDQVMFAPRAEYAFHHPLIRTVAYESQLKADRTSLHRRLAASIERRDPEAADENAALIAEHWEAAGDLHATFSWHMRAGSWFTYRDIAAATRSWQRARQVADQLPEDDPGRPAMRIAPRTLLCGHAYRIGGSVADTGFDELRELTSAVDDKLSLAIGMAGLLVALTFNGRVAESSQLASECVGLIESIGDPVLSVALLGGPLQAKFQAGEVVEVMRLAQRIIDLAGGDPTMGNLAVGSPLAIAQMFRAAAGMHLGAPEFRDDYDQAIATARSVDPTSLATTVTYKYLMILCDVFLPDETADRDTSDALVRAERSGDRLAVTQARLARAVVQLCRNGADRDAALAVLARVREMALARQFTFSGVDTVDIALARTQLADADFDGAIELCRTTLARLYAAGDRIWLGAGTCTLVESLLRRGADGDVPEAAAAIDRLAAVPTDPGFVWHEIPLLRSRAMLARAQDDEQAYRTLALRYRTRAAEVGFDGHAALAAAMD
jgi:adenylate cyclase